MRSAESFGPRASLVASAHRTELSPDWKPGRECGGARRAAPLRSRGRLAAAKSWAAALASLRTLTCLAQSSGRGGRVPAVSPARRSAGRGWGRASHLPAHAQHREARSPLPSPDRNKQGWPASPRGPWRPAWSPAAVTTAGCESHASFNFQVIFQIILIRYCFNLTYISSMSDINISVFDLFRWFPVCLAAWADLDSSAGLQRFSPPGAGHTATLNTGTGEAQGLRGAQGDGSPSPCHPPLGPQHA